MGLEGIKEFRFAKRKKASMFKKKKPKEGYIGHKERYEEESF